MTKEQIFELLKDSILSLRDREKELRSNPDQLKAWVNQSKKVTDSAKDLNSCDSNWLTDEYGKWAKEVLMPEAEKRSDKVDELKKIWGLK